VIIATDCDREGQLIGQEILEHLSYRGSVQRALFTAQDPKTLRQAFATLKPQPRDAPPLRGGGRAPAQCTLLSHLDGARLSPFQEY